jgi:hypothetical protein
MDRLTFLFQIRQMRLAFAWSRPLLGPVTMAEVLMLIAR